MTLDLAQFHDTFFEESFEALDSMAFSESELTLKPGDSLHVRPGMIHAHRNASSMERLVFLEFVIVDKGQRSTVPMR